MNKPLYRAVALLSTSAALLAAPVVLAGSATLISNDGGTATFEYNDSMLRIGSDANPESYALMRDGKFYTVSVNNGQPIVIDAGSMMKGMGSMNMAPTTVTSDFDVDVLSVKDTGKNETVAGIKGDVYEIRFRDEDGQERSETMVLSKDKRVREFSDALFRMMNVAAEFASDKAMKQGQDMRSKLEELDAGVLRYGNEMRISSIDGDKVPGARFELPAQPMNLEGFGAMLGNLSNAQSEANESSEYEEEAEESGGLFSSMMGALGGKAKRQEDRVEGKVEGKVDEKTDEAVDSVLDKALGKLFGD